MYSRHSLLAPIVIACAMLMGSIIIVLAIRDLGMSGTAKELRACADIENVDKSVACFAAINR